LRVGGANVDEDVLHEVINDAPGDTVLQPVQRRVGRFVVEKEDGQVLSELALGDNPLDGLSLLVLDRHRCGGGSQVGAPEDDEEQHNGESYVDRYADSFSRRPLVAPRSAMIPGEHQDRGYQ
jgi:hypothetical protein